MFTKQVYLDQIIEGLQQIERTIEYKGLLNLLDTHILAEDFFASFLNICYGYSLENLNIAKSLAGIDLECVRRYSLSNAWDHP